MKSSQIKYHALLFIFTGYIFVCCDHKNTEREYSERENEVNERAIENRNSGASNQPGYVDMDTSDLKERDEGYIPLKVYNVIRNDSSLRHQEVVDSRPIRKENQIFFEVHFQLDDKITTVIFDKEGNHTNDFN